MAENNQGVINALKQSQVEGARVIKDELKESFKPFADQLMAPLQSMKAGIDSLPGVGVTKKLFSAVSKPLKASFNADSKTDAKEQKQINADERDKDKNQTLMEDIRDGIFGLKDGLLAGLAGLKDKGLMGLGILAGLVAAPFVAISAFFTQLVKEVKFLDTLLKGGLSKAFAPIKAFFNNLGTKFKGTGLGKTIDTFLDTVKNLFKVGDIKGFKGLAMFEDLQKTFGRATRPILGVINGIKRFGRRVSRIFRTIKSGLSSMKGFMKGFGAIQTFARTVGTVLGKIFLPVTVLMTLFDTVKGAVKGYEDDGWLGALEGGLSGLLTSIIGMPLDLLKSAVAWMLGMFGFDESADALKSFSFSQLITDGIGAVFDFGKKAFAWFGQLFTDPVTALKNLWTGLVGEGGFLDLITTPFNLAVNWLLGLFGWSDPENKFNFLSTVTGAFTMAVQWVKDLFSWPEDGNVGTAVTKFIDIILAPYNLAVNWLMGLFGFKPEDFGQEGESFSIGKLVVDAIKGIYEWFKGLLDIDVGAIVSSIPGASTVLKALGIIDESPAEKAKNIKTAIAEAQNRITRSEGGENVYFGREGVGQSDDKEEIASLQQELLELQSQNKGTTIINQIDNSTNNSGNSSNQTLSSTQLVDGAAPAGAKMD